MPIEASQDVDLDTVMGAYVGSFWRVMAQVLTLVQADVLVHPIVLKINVVNIYWTTRIQKMTVNQHHTFILELPFITI